MRRTAWRTAIEGAREQKRRKDDEDRASGIAKMRSMQFAMEDAARARAAVILLQRMYRTWKGRQVFAKVKQALVTGWRKQAAAKVQMHLSTQWNSVEFQAQVWQAAMVKHTKDVLPDVLMEENDTYESIVAKSEALIPLDLQGQYDELKGAMATLTEDCYREFAIYEALLAEEVEVNGHIAYFNTVKSLTSCFRRDTIATIDALAPFATQGRYLVQQTSDLAKENQRLTYEMHRLNRLRSALYTKMKDRLEFDPLMYELDIERVIDDLEPEWAPNSKSVQAAVYQRIRQDEIRQLNPDHES
jgi:hypothetical protein